MANLLKLTPYQTAYLADRPADCVVECVCDIYGVKDSEAVCAADDHIESLLRYDHGKNKYKAVTINVDRLSDLERKCLLDRYEGSTMVGQLGDPMPGAETLALQRALKTTYILRDKLKACGFNVRTIPNW